MELSSNFMEHIGSNLSKVRARIACLGCMSSQVTPRLRDSERSSSMIIGGNNCASTDSTDKILMPVMVAESGKPVLKWFPVQRKARGPEAAWAAKTVELKMAEGQTDGTEDAMTSHSPKTASSHTNRSYSRDAGPSDCMSENEIDDEDADDGAESLMEVIWDDDFMEGLRSWPYILSVNAQNGEFLPNSPRQSPSGSDSHLDPEMLRDTPASLVSDIVLEEFDDDTDWASDSEFDNEEEGEEKKCGKSRSLWQKIKKFFTRR